MNCIFDEEKAIKVTGSVDYYANVIAWFNEAHQVLCVDTFFTILNQKERFLETQETHTDAIRRTIHIADYWYALCAALVPQEED